MIYRIAVIDDEAKDIAYIGACISRHFGSPEQFQVVTFTSPTLFLNGYEKGFDLIFLDLMLPGINGLDVAKKIREKDSTAMIVFITSMAQYAIAGYEVDASDYIVKPFTFECFQAKFRRLIEKLEAKNATEEKICIKEKEGYAILNKKDIVYLESAGHYVIYHTADRTYKQREAFKEVSARFEGDEFASCNKGYIINLRFVKKVDDLFVTVIKDEKLLISRLKKKAFLNALAAYHLKR